MRRSRPVPLVLQRWRIPLLAFAFSAVSCGIPSPHGARFFCAVPDDCLAGFVCVAHACRSVAPATDDAGLRDAGSVDAGGVVVLGGPPSMGPPAPDAGAPVVIDAGAPSAAPDSGAQAPPGDGGAPGGGPTSPPTNLVDLVPAMTGATTPAGAVTSSGLFGAGYEAWHAFDNAPQHWLSNGSASTGSTPEVWLAYEWGGGVRKTALAYELRYNNGSCCEQRGPRDWRLEGKRDGVWTVVDAVSGQSGWYGNPIRQFTVEAPGAFEAYRLTVTADNYGGNGITVVTLNALRLLGEP